MAAIIHAPLCIAALLVAGIDAQAPIVGYECAMSSLHYLCSIGEKENDLIKLLDGLQETTEQSARRNFLWSIRHCVQRRGSKRDV